MENRLDTNFCQEKSWVACPLEMDDSFSSAVSQSYPCLTDGDWQTEVINDLWIMHLQLLHEK